MANVPIPRVISKLDEYLHKNDYDGALRHLLYWKDESVLSGDERSELTLTAELMGLYRKTGKRERAISAAERAVELVEKTGLSDSVTAGTIFIDAATVFNAFSDQERSLFYFEKAKTLYEKFLPETDGRLPALYNNFALNLAALCRYEEAQEFFKKALSLCGKQKKGADMAITYLNLANLYEKRDGFENAIDEISDCLSSARELLESETSRDGYYAFVCEKCAGTFGHYGMKDYAETLLSRAKEIYERA